MYTVTRYVKINFSGKVPAWDFFSFAVTLIRNYQPCPQIYCNTAINWNAPGTMSLIQLAAGKYCNIWTLYKSWYFCIRVVGLHENFICKQYIWTILNHGYKLSLRLKTLENLVFAYFTSNLFKNQCVHKFIDYKT